MSYQYEMDGAQVIGMLMILVDSVCVILYIGPIGISSTTCHELCQSFTYKEEIRSFTQSIPCKGPNYEIFILHHILPTRFPLVS